MKWFQNSYTRCLNTRHRQSGHLYGNRYKSKFLVIKNRKEASLLTSLDGSTQKGGHASGGAKRKLVAPDAENDWLAVIH